MRKNYTIPRKVRELQQYSEPSEFGNIIPYQEK